MDIILRKKRLFSDTRIFIGIIATLILIGLIFIYSSSYVYALERFGSATYFVRKQLIGLVLGLCACCCMRTLPYSLLYTATPYGFFAALLLTGLTLFPGLVVRIHGSSRWLSCGGFAFQPSELLKIAFIMYMAYFLSKRKLSTTSLVHTYIPFLCILALSSLLLLQQPDFGMTVNLALTAFVMLYIAHIKTLYLVCTLATCIPLGIMLIILKPYRMQRILTFLDPWSDPQGSGFQIIQSLIAIGSGSFFGQGIAHSKQKFFYLPMQHTDFIFAIIAEETGFVGATLLITLFLLFTYYGIRIALSLTRPFSLLGVLGFVIVTTLQALINLTVTLGLVPTKGIGLPFISYGSTSLVCNLMMVGICMNMIYNDN